MKLSVVIVNYNAGDYLLKCLQSIELVKAEADISVYLVDNASTDGSIADAQKRFPKLNYILNKDNIGFGRANNQALSKVKDGYILILNPDCELRSGVVEEMVNFMEQNPKVGAATCRVLLEDGRLDWATHRGFPTPLASLTYFLGNDSKYHLSKEDLNSYHEVDAISGAFFFSRVEVLKKVGLFDEDYFMYAEDIDLCYRIKGAGFKIMYVPAATIIHHKGISSGLKKHSQQNSAATIETRKRSLDAFYSTMKIFYKKHLEQKYPFFINWFIYLVINMKWDLAKRKLIV